MNCRSCKKFLKKPKIIFKDYPISLWPCDKQLSKKKINMLVYNCQKCSLIQLQKFSKKKISLFYKNESKVLFNKNIIKSRTLSIKENLKNIHNKKALEIGGGRNMIIHQLKFKEKYLCDFDIINNNSNVKTIKADFNEVKGFKNYFDYIFFFHTLEHIENPSFFLKNVFNKLKPEGKIILEIPNSKYYQNKIPYYAFFFQHQTLMSLNSLKNLMMLNNFIFEKKLKTDNSVILAIFKKKIIKNKILIKDKKILKHIIINLNKKIFNLKNFIKSKKIKKIALYGSGGTSMTLHYHLKKNKILINSFYDNDIRKINLFIPGTNKKVISGEKFNQNSYDLIVTTNNELKIYLNKIKINKPIISLE